MATEETNITLEITEDSYTFDIEGAVIHETGSDNTKADKVGDDDIEITDAAKGIILKSTSGLRRFRLRIEDSGLLFAEEVV